VQGALEDSCFQEVTTSIAYHRTVPLVTPCYACRRARDGTFPEEARPSHKPRHNFLSASGESTRPYLAYISSTSPRAAQQLEKARKASEPRSSNLQGYTDPVRSAKLLIEVNKFGSSSFLILLAKSEAPPIHLQRNAENHVWRHTDSCETDFAISIKCGQEPKLFCKIWFPSLTHGA
jgi:hypothetical protein